MVNQGKNNILSSRSSQMILLTIAYICAMFVCIVNNEAIDTLGYSISYVALTIISYIVVWYSSNRQISLFFLYQISFSIFIGGRFWVGLFDNSIDIFETTFFYSYNVTAKDASSLMIWVYSFMYFTTIGYVLSRKKRKKMIELTDKKMNAQKCATFAKVVFPIVIICILYQGITGIIFTFAHGYGVSLEDVTGQEYNKSFVTVINSFLGVMMLAFTNVYARSEYPKYLKLYGIYGVLVLISGSRFAFASIMLIFIWLYSTEKKIGILKILLYGVAGVVALLVLFSLSARGAGLEGFSIMDSFKIFLYTSGGSLMIFHASTLVHGYPWIAYIQTFIPGSTLLYSKLSGQQLHIQNLTFQGHMCYNLNPDLYSQGAGLGWSSLSDFYFFSGEIILFFCILAFCFGIFFSFLENKADVDPKYKFVIIAISQGVLMMPRGTSSPMFVGVIYALVFIYFVKNYWLRRWRNHMSVIHNGTNNVV